MWLNKDNLLITNTCVLFLFTCLIIFFEKTALPSQYLHKKLRRGPCLDLRIPDDTRDPPKPLQTDPT